MISSDVDAVHLVEAALANDVQGVDSWELEPLTPLPSPEHTPPLKACLLAVDIPCCEPLPPALCCAIQPAAPAAASCSAALQPSSWPPDDAPSLGGLASNHDFQARSNYGDAGKPGSSTQPSALDEVTHSRKTQPSRKIHASKGKRARRNKKRAEEKEAGLGRKARSSYSKRALQVAALKGNLDADRLPIAQGAFVGKQLTNVEKECPPLEELLEDGYKYIEWDGRCVLIVLPHSWSAHRPPGSQHAVQDPRHAWPRHRASCRPACRS